MHHTNQCYARTNIKGRHITAKLMTQGCGEPLFACPISGCAHATASQFLNDVAQGPLLVCLMRWYS